MVSPYDSRQVANRLINLSNQSGVAMSIMRLLKLTYMTHGWTLAVLERPLVNDYVQAWKYGPVIPGIYYSFRPHGVYNLNPIPLVHESVFDQDVDDLISSVYDIYGSLSASQLSALTHIKDGPWYTKYKKGERGIIIPNELIAEHFKDKLKRSRNDDTSH